MDTFECATQKKTSDSKIIKPFWTGRALVSSSLSSEQAPFFDSRHLPFLGVSCYAAGIIAYLFLPQEPKLWALMLVALLLSLFYRHLSPFGYLRSKLKLLLMVLAGLITGALHGMAEVTILVQPVEGVIVRGWLESNETTASGARGLVVRVVSTAPRIHSLSDAKIRIVTRIKKLPEVGNFIRFRASLSPPPDPLLHGDYDSALRYFFNGLSAAGFATSQFDTQIASFQPWGITLRAKWHRWRYDLVKRLESSTSTLGGGLIKALIAGDKSGLGSSILQAVRDAGVAHILAISGLHMMLISGTVFWLVRAALALSSGLAQRYNIKAWAALAGMAGASFYLFLSGASIPTQRAWIMVMIGFIAILAGRRALSMRNIMIAALIILTISPEQILEPGFQMTFSATISLILYYQWRRGGVDYEKQQFWWQKVMLSVMFYLRSIVETTLVASAATLPLVAYFFNTISLVGIVGNMLILPLLGLVVMPAAVLSLFLMPFGLDPLVLTPMDWCARVILDIAHWVASLPGAHIALPAFPGAIIGLSALTLLLAVSLRAKWRLAALIPAFSSLALFVFSEQPAIMVSKSGKTVFVYNKTTDRYDVSYIGSGERFLRQRWLSVVGDKRRWNEAGRDEGAFNCSDIACTVSLNEKTKLVHLKKTDKTGAFCYPDAIIISTEILSCQESEAVLSPETMRRGNVTLSYDGIRWQREDSVQSWYRPWNRFRAALHPSSALSDSETTDN